MTKKFLALAIAGVMLVGCQQDKAATAEVATEAAQSELSTTEAKVAYGIGRNIGMNFKNQEIELDIDIFVSGLKDALAGNDSRLSDEEIMQAMQAFQAEQAAKKQAAMETAGADNKANGEAFLAENLKKEGVQVSESGLQYKVITAGEGAKPTATDTVEVNYRGTFIDGEEFDSSYKRGQSVSFPVNGVIPGWTEALQLMSPGAKFELYIPADLAYGSGGSGRIGPNSTLVFEVELISIKSQEAKPEAAAEAK